MCSNSQMLAQQQSNTLYKNWGRNTTTGKYEHARKCCHAILSVLSCFLLLLLFIFTFQSCPLQLFTFRLHSLVHSSYRSLYVFTLHLCSPNSLFLLLVFILANQSRGSRSYCSSCFLPTLFNQPLGLFRHRYSLFFSFFILAVRTHALMWGQCGGGDSLLSEHSHVRTYELASHTFTCVTLPVTCTVNWIVLRLVAVMELSSYDVLIFEDLL